MNLAESTPASADDWHLAELTQALRTPAVGRAMVLSERPEALAALGISDRCSVRTSADEAAVWQSLRCQHQALPVQAGSLDLLVLHEVLDGDQPELIAAARHCLRAGGRLLILAHGCLSPGRWRSAGRDCPRVRLGPLRHRLAQFGFESRRWHGRSIGGLGGALQQDWQQPFLPLCEYLLVDARRRAAPPNVRLVRFTRPKVAMGAGTALDGMSRESVL